MEELGTETAAVLRRTAEEIAMGAGCAGPPPVRARRTQSVIDGKKIGQVTDPSRFPAGSNVMNVMLRPRPAPRADR